MVKEVKEEPLIFPPKQIDSLEWTTLKQASDQFQKEEGTVQKWMDTEIV